MITPNIVEAVQPGPPDLFDPGESFTEASKLHRQLIEAEVPGIRALVHNPALVDATSRATKLFTLRQPFPLPSLSQMRLPHVDSFITLLQGRRSPRAITKAAPLIVDQIAFLCWATDGINGEIGPDRQGRTAPSGGALYPRDLYISVVDGEIPGGLYHYNPYASHLEYVNAHLPSDFTACTPQSDALSDAVAVVIVTAVFWRNRVKYDQRGVRFTFMELGHVAQNCLLAATAIGYTALPLGGFYDDEVNELVYADGLHETAAYVIAVGGKADCDVSSRSATDLGR